MGSFQLSVTLLAQVHSNIRADPSPQKKERKQPAEKKKWKQTKLTYEQRKANLKVRLQSAHLPRLTHVSGKLFPTRALMPAFAD